MYRYLLFDLDGTLTDSAPGICRCVQYALGKMGIEVTDLKPLEVFVGPPLRQSFQEHFSLNEEEAETAVAFYRERFSTIGKYENSPYPGIAELLDALKTAGYKLAVASSKPEVFVDDIMRHFELYGYFDCVVGSDLEGKRDTKAAVIREVIRRMEITQEMRSELLMIGDRCFDIDGAREEGLKSVGVYYGFAKEGELEAAGADFIVNTVAELGNLLLEKMNE